MNAERILSIATAADEEMAQRLRFMLEIDRLKGVLRKNLLADGSRRENSAEHSWHLAMTAIVLAPHAKEPIDLERAVKTLLIHDIVEIDAGDIDIYDAEAREAEAAQRLFSLLPEPDATELRQLWQEFTDLSTPEARFAYSCDRLQPFLLNLAVGGKTWHERGVTAGEVRAVNRRIDLGLEGVWPAAESMLQAAIDEGLLAP